MEQRIEGKEKERE